MWIKFSYDKDRIKKAINLDHVKMVTAGEVDSEHVVSIFTGEWGYTLQCWNPEKAQQVYDEICDAIEYGSGIKEIGKSAIQYCYVLRSSNSF